MTREYAALVVTGSRGRWLAVAVWLLIGAAGLLAHGHIDDVTAAGQSSFLPADSESTRALDALQRASNGSEDVPVVIVFERRGGLSDGDLKAIGRIGNGLGELELAGATPIVDPFSGEYRNQLTKVARLAKGIGPVSRDGEAALLVLAIDAQDRGAVVKGVGQIRRYLRAHEQPGVHAYVTGPGGIAADLEAIASDAARTLLFATLGLVLLLLLLVYRAPILALLPLLVVGLAYLVATGIAYLLIEAGSITVNAEGTMLLLVLIFGAGTDYSLLLVHRYREELGAVGGPGGPLRHKDGEVPPGTPRTPLETAVRETRRDRSDVGPPCRELGVNSLAGTRPRHRNRSDAAGRLHPAAGVTGNPRRQSFLARQPRRRGSGGFPEEPPQNSRRRGPP